MTEPTNSYDAIPDFGLLYDGVPLYQQRRDVQFYVSEAERVQGRVLELGCGTGRILLPIARAGRDITGIDASAHMLDRCRSKLDGEPEEVRRRVVLHQSDVREFELGERFALVIAPFRVFQHMTTIDDQLRLLGAVARHLEPGGRFVFDVFNPNFAALLSADGTEHEDTPDQQLPDSRLFRRTARVKRVRWLDQVSEVELLYYVTPRAEATPERFVQAFDMRWFLRAELLHLLVRAGFREIVTYGDMDRAPLVDGCPDFVICAERA